MDDIPSIKQIPDEPLNAVPAVPTSDQFSFTPNEREMLRGIDLESLTRIDEVKRLFNGTVVSVIDKKP
jgi:hypothetical protein